MPPGRERPCERWEEALGGGWLVFNGHTISVGGAKKVLEMNDGDRCTTV